MSDNKTLSSAECAKKLKFASWGLLFIGFAMITLFVVALLEDMMTVRAVVGDQARFAHETQRTADDLSAGLERFYACRDASNGAASACLVAMAEDVHSPVLAIAVSPAIVIALAEEGRALDDDAKASVRRMIERGYAMMREDPLHTLPRRLCEVRNDSPLLRMIHGMQDCSKADEHMRSLLLIADVALDAPEAYMEAVERMRAGL